MEKLERASRKWWFFVILLTAQSVLLPIVSRNFDPQNIPRMVSVTLGNAVQNHLGNLNILFQSVSLLMLVLLVVFKNKVRKLFNAYVAVSYTAAFSGEPWNDNWSVKDATTHVGELLESKQHYGLECIVDGEVTGFHLITAREGDLPSFYERFGFKKEERVMLMGL